jgi:hypothetical protein
MMMKRTKLALSIAVCSMIMLTSMQSVAGNKRPGDGRGSGADRFDMVHESQHERRSAKFQRYVDKRQDRQWRRIDDGVDSGELTRKEAGNLKRQQQRIARLEEQYLSDGHYSRKERRKLTEKLDRASERIYRKKHNDKVRLRERYTAGIWRPADGLGLNDRETGYLELFFSHSYGYPSRW